MKDLFGQAILDYQVNNSPENLFTETDITETDEMEVSYLFRTYQDMPKLEQKALDMSSGKVLDIGCGAGNYPVKLAHQLSNFDCTLVDLSQPMLDKAYERLQGLTSGKVEIIKGDFRTVALKENSYDVIIATAVLHHLRDDQDWEQAFEKLYRLLKKGGSLWIFDLVIQDHEAIQHLIYHQHYVAYLTNLKDESYRDHVFNYIEYEDTPRSLTYQLNLLKTVGFNFVDVLHKKLNFASFVAFK